MNTPSRRFARRSRLTRASEFKVVFDQSRRVWMGAVACLLTLNALGRPRLGMVVSKKSAPKAIMRNRLKRVIREHFRAAQYHLGGVDIVILTGKGIAGYTPEKMRAILRAHFESAQKFSASRAPLPVVTATKEAPCVA